MKEKKTRDIFCPSCKMSLHRSEFRQVNESLITTGVSQYYACDNCINSKKAILANPKVQQGAWFAHLAYFDENRTCQTCGDDYIFSKEEKKHWYEKLQFWVYAQSVNCKNCSKEIRVERNLNTRLSNLLKNGEDELSTNQITEIISIYQVMKKPERVKYFKSKLPKFMQ